MITEEAIKETYESMKKYKSKGGKALIKYLDNGKYHLGIFDTTTNTISELPDSDEYFDES